MPAEPITVPMMACRVQRAICRRTFSPIVTDCEAFERDEADGLSAYPPPLPAAGSHGRLGHFET
jgi:hypothetical protein